MMNAQARIESAISDATPSLSRVGRWMSMHPIQTLSHSAEEIASLTGTSVAAVNRFARAAGFDGFAHLKTSLGAELQSAIEPLHKIGAGPGKQSAAGVIDANAFQSAVSAPEVRKAASRLLKARRVLLLGLGKSSYLAGYAAHTLMPFLEDVWAVAISGGTEEAARRLSRCGRGDVVLAVSLPRYSKDTVRMTEMARERGAYIIAVTDSVNAPLAALAHCLLLAPSEHPVMPSSALGAVAVIEALAAIVLELNPDAAKISREMSEMVLSHLVTS
jgi:DNA-binding MurR/RpiR family transcriptional regulator